MPQTNTINHPSYKKKFKTISYVSIKHERSSLFIKSFRKKYILVY